MSSPLKVFRKHQKILMAAATILAMIAFVFIGPWSGIYSGSSGPMRNQEVFTWKYGTVRESDLEHRRRGRITINRFFNGVANLPNARNPQAGLRYPIDDGNIIRAIEFSKLAEELGITVSDDLVYDELRGRAGQVLGEMPSDPTLAAVIANPDHSGRRIVETELIDSLRSEMEAAFALTALTRSIDRSAGQFFVQFKGDTPAERWDYYQRLNRKATVQVLPVDVEQFLSQADEPTAVQLQDFYDEYKDVLPTPNSPTPGFRYPDRARFEYFKVDGEKLIEEEKRNVTDEEIAKYYEENKDRDFRKARLSEPPPTDEKSGDEGPAGGEAEPADKENTEAQPMTGDVPPQDSDSSADNKKSESNEPSTGREPTAPAPDAQAPAPSDLKAEPSDQKSSDASKSSLASRNELFAMAPIEGQLAALADEPTTDENEGEQKDADTPASDSADGDAADGKTSATPPADAAAGDSATTENSATEAEASPVEYEPLEKVSDTIRTRLAVERAEKRVQEIFDKLIEPLDRYQRQYSAFKAGARKQPEPLDLAEMAKPYSDVVQAMETKLISAQQAFDDTDIGRSHVASSGLFAQSEPFIRVAYGNLPEFQARQSTDVESNHYLWWKAEFVESRVPTLEEIKDEVVRAWKMIEARKSALAKAKQYAEEVRASNKPMKEFFSGELESKVAAIGPFTWMSRNDQSPFAPPELTELSGVENAGPTFMQEVFSLPKNGVGVAPNQPQTVYYVIQAIEFEPPLDELRKDFLIAMSSPRLWRDVAVVSWQDHGEQGRKLMKQVEDQLEVRMNPDYTPRDSESG